MSVNRFGFAVLLAGGLAIAQTPTGPGKWSPTYLDTGIPNAAAETYQRAYQVRMAADAYLYGLPAYLWVKQRYEFLYNFTHYMGEQGNPFGKFLLMRSPASPDTTDPQPNYDTLYGATFLELTGFPVVLDVPDIPGRYYSFAFGDAYFYNFAYIGSRTTGQKGGKYLIVGPGWKGSVPAGIRRTVRCPTPSIHVYERIYFRNLEDAAEVRRIQDQIKLMPLATYLDPKAKVVYPAPAPYLAGNPQLAADPLAVLEIANRAMAENPPPIEDRTYIESFAPVGVGPGMTLPADDSAKLVLREGAAQAGQTMSVLALLGFQVRNGWQVPPPKVAERGAPGGVAIQAMIQLRAIGLNTPEEAVYYMAYIDGAGQALTASNRYALHFSKAELPPIDRPHFGFWSVTMYERESGKLVANPANKYSVRSAEPLVYGPDGSLTIYIQNEPPEEGRLRPNWLPAAKSGEFLLTLRAYIGERPVVDGSYAPPPVRKVQ